MLETLIDLFLHLDRHLAEVVVQYGAAIYALLFAIVFLETGIVVTPFLPGDSLLFACGALAATGALEMPVLLVILPLAAILGDTANYHIGKYVGPKAFTSRSRWLKHEHLVRTRAFYERHGGKTIVLARFVPIIRTFAPFVAGIGVMSYARFIWYNVAGGLLWVVLCLGAGYLFGNIPVVKDNFSIVVILIVAISLVPIAIEWLKHRKGSGTVSRPRNGA